MARVTVEDCLKRIPNRFFLVHAAAKRVRQLREGADRLVHAPENEDIVAALREIAAGKVFVTQYYTDYQEEGPGEAGQEQESGAESAS
ncbi:MAG: DNA-directed RNA polymerase subunit omega [Desulfosalsimonas sp.]